MPYKIIKERQLTSAFVLKFCKHEKIKKYKDIFICEQCGKKFKYVQKSKTILFTILGVILGASIVKYLIKRRSK